MMTKNRKSPVGPNVSAQYKAFLARIREDRPRCESCGALPAEVGQARLHAHHCMHVASLGIHDPAVFDGGNVLVLCNACHALMHPGLRRYDWDKAAGKRGASFA